MLLNIGLDDIDSVEGGCTTYVASRIVKALVNLGIIFSDYPNLIRLNPNIPWKTRGNGAVALRILFEGKNTHNIFSVVCSIIKKHALSDSNPGVVMLRGDVPNDIVNFSKLAMHTLVTKKKALTLVRKHDLDSFELGSGLGIIGALSSIGCTLEEDHTFEVISYRTQGMWGKRREVNRASILTMNKKMGHVTFNNIDPETNRILITPRGPDPVLFGIRGNGAASVLRSKDMVSTGEPFEYMLYRTNQGTGAHLEHFLNIRELKPYSSGRIDGSISTRTVTMEGGHVMFKIKNQEGEVNCAAYQQTGSLKERCRALEIGDIVEIGGGVRRASSRFPRALNLEFLRVLYLKPQYQWINPKCNCGRIMESAGHEKGYRCRECGAKNRTGRKEPREKQRTISTGFYQPPPRAQRHLTKPMARIGKEKVWNNQKLKAGWYSFKSSDLF